MWTAGGWNWIWMTLMMVAFWGGIVVVIAWAVRRPSWDRPPSDRPSSEGDAAKPAQILEERFARGEITSQELQDGRRLLGVGSAGTPD